MHHVKLYKACLCSVSTDVRHVCAFHFISNFWSNPTKSRRIRVSIGCDGESWGNWKCSHTHTRIKMHMVGYGCVNRYSSRCTYHYVLTQGAAQINPLCNLPLALRKEWTEAECQSSDAAGRCLSFKCAVNTGWMRRNKHSSQVKWRPTSHTRSSDLISITPLTGQSTNFYLCAL